MARYGDINVDFSGMNTMERVQDILTKASQRRIMNSNQQYLEDTREQLKQAENALNKWKAYSSSPVDVFSPDVFDTKFNYHTDFENAWQGYKRDSGVNYPDKALFRQKFNEDFQEKVMSIANKFSAHRETIRASSGVTDITLLNKIMQKNYNADNLFNEIATVLGAEGAQKALSYSPPEKPKSWKQAAKDIFQKPSYTDPETGETIGGGMKGMWGLTIPGALWGATQQYKEFGRNKADILKEAKANQKAYKQKWKTEPEYAKYKIGKKKGKFKLDKNKKKIIIGKTKTATGVQPGSGLEADDFKKKYGNIQKNKAFDSAGKPTKAFNKVLNQQTFPTTKAGKVLRAGRRNMPGLAGFGVGSTIGGSLGKMTGSEEAEFIGSIGGGVGGQFGMRKLWKALKNPETLTKLKSVAAKSGKKTAITKALAKLGISAAGYMGPQALEPYSTAVGVAGTAWAAYDLYQIAKEVPALMDILTGE